ncbi:MAG: hypothetical protein IKF68_06405 [Erysipelotrichaceae bacterium]|nr:hypothetical protein [Erysipelotrichaceae bacterium]
MKRLTYKIECLWGEYVFEALIDEQSVTYRTHSDIEGFTDKEGEPEEKERFLELLKEARIPSWDDEYDGESLIEDAVEWSLEYAPEGGCRRIRGKEGCWPYGYEKFIAAIRMCDEDIDRF